MLSAPLAILRFFRLPNLFIVVLSQAIPYWCVLRPAIAKSGGMAVLDERSFARLSLATVLTTLAGYVINDYFDRQIDAINRPKTVVVGRYLPAGLALALYWLLQVAIAWLAYQLYVELPGGNGKWAFWLFPLVSFSLFIYAWQLKCTPIMGNMLVALLCGITPLIMLLPESRALSLGRVYHPELIRQAVSIVWIYGLFAFVTNLLREQIKDLEDIQGDAACGCNTLAVVRGVRYAKKNAGLTGLAVMILTALLLLFWQETGQMALRLALGLSCLMLPVVASVLLLWRATEKKHFSQASVALKVAMLTGIVILVPYLPDNLMAWQYTLNNIWQQLSLIF
jgi:4-hydroxybenzoate polyprenyltransferase